MIDRDEGLGAELRRLNVPDHGPEFFAHLAERLDRDPAQDQSKDRRPHWQPPMYLGLAAAAAVVVLVATSTLFAGSGRTPVRPAPSEPQLVSATVVRGRVSTALASLRSLSGLVTIECAAAFGQCSPPAGGGRATLQWSFVTTAAGDERITGIGRTDDVSYSASQREQRAVSDVGRPSLRVTTNLPPGPPDFAAQSTVLRRDVASVVRAFLDTTSDVPVTDVEEQGRPAWRLVTPVTPNKLAGPGGSGDQLEVVVDREGGFPLRITETLGTQFLHELRLSQLVVDGPVDPASFLLDLPSGGGAVAARAQPLRQDVGFRRVNLGEVAAVVGYVTMLPSPASLPPGYKLAEVTVAPQSQATGSEGANPLSRNVVSVAYRRGFDSIVVTTRSLGTALPCSAAPRNETCWADPLASGEGFFDQPERYTVAGGALAGAQAELVISPRGVPHVWTVDTRLMVTVAGDASADELRRMAESFAPAG